MTRFELLRHDAVVTANRPVQIVERDEKGVVLYEYTGYYQADIHIFKLYPCPSMIATRSGARRRYIDADLVKRPSRRCGIS